MRIAALVGLAVGLTACVAPAETLSPEAGPVFRPEVFFEGDTRGVGRLVVVGRAPELVRVRSQGRMQVDSTFRLDQTITFGADRVETRTWLLERAAPGVWTGTLTEASGVVTMTTHRDVLRIGYRLGSGVRIEQDLRLLPGGQSVLNRATVRFVGLPIGRLEERIWRTTPNEPLAPEAGTVPPSDGSYTLR